MGFHVWDSLKDLLLFVSNSNIIFKTSLVVHLYTHTQRIQFQLKELDRYFSIYVCHRGTRIVLRHRSFSGRCPRFLIMCYVGNLPQKWRVRVDLCRCWCTARRVLRWRLVWGSCATRTWGSRCSCPPWSGCWVASAAFEPSSATHRLSSWARDLPWTLTCQWSPRASCRSSRPSSPSRY